MDSTALDVDWQTEEDGREDATTRKITNHKFHLGCTCNYRASVLQFIQRIDNLMQRGRAHAEHVIHVATLL